MKKIYAAVLPFLLAGAGAYAQEAAYKRASETPGANYYTITAGQRAELNAKRDAYLAEHPGQPLPQQLREEIAQFERWAYNWRDRVDGEGHFPSSSAQGWINQLEKNPKAFDVSAAAAVSKTTNAVVWTSIGPLDSAISNGWTYGAGIGRINAIRKVPGTNTLLAGSAAGGIFRSTNMGTFWTPVTDNLAGLGISDIAIDPNNASVMYAATGDWDAKHMHSIGVYKSTNGGVSWNATGLVFPLSSGIVIAHLAVDPANSNTVYATGRDAIHRTLDGGATWTEFYKPGTNYFFNDIIKIGADWFVTDKYGEIYKSNPAGTTISTTFQSIYNNGKNERLDFAWTPANPDTLYLLSQSNPAFAKFSVVSNQATAYTNITNSNPTDNNGNFNTQQGYNQVIAVSPSNKDSVWVGEFSGKLSPDGGATWTNKMNGYYDPGSSTSNWGGGYVHSDHHDFHFVNGDMMLVGNDGGVYVGNPVTNAFQQKFNGLMTTQSYSLAIYDPEPGNMMLGNQDNDGSSRAYDGNAYQFYGAQAGDGTATAIHRGDSLTRYVGGTNGSLSYRSDAFKTNYSGTSDNTPTGGPFVWDLQMHSTDGTILYGGFADLHKKTSAPTGTWTALNSGAGQIKSITLADNNATTQKIIVIGTNNTIRKSADESTWSTVTPPAGVTFTSIYATKSNWDTLFATASGYTAANKIFMSINNGTTWTNITKNFPNIVAKKIMRYEGSDTLFVATEIGVYVANISSALNTSNAWSVFGVGMPNVRVEDMEISYAKKQLYVGSFGRGVWMAPLTAAPIPLPTPHVFNFGLTAQGSRKFLRWNIEGDGIKRTVLEKSLDGQAYRQLTTFTGAAGLKQDAFAVDVEQASTYYRLHTLDASGTKAYSQTVVVDASGAVQNVRLYPNPTSSTLHVVSDVPLKTVQIFGMNGQQLCYARPSAVHYSFDMSLLPRGTYIVQLTDVAGNTSRHAVVRK